MPESALEKIVRLSGKPPWLNKGADAADKKEDKKSPSDMTDAELKAEHAKESGKKKMPWMKEDSPELKLLVAEMKKRKLST